MENKLKKLLNALIVIIENNKIEKTDFVKRTINEAREMATQSNIVHIYQAKENHDLKVGVVDMDELFINAGKIIFYSFYYGKTLNKKIKKISLNEAKDVVITIWE